MTDLISNLTAKKLLAIATLIIAMLLIVATLQHNQIRKFQYILEHQDTITRIERDTFWRDTTIIQTQIKPTYITRIKTDTLIKTNGDTLNLITESKRYDRSFVSNKDTADLQIYTTGINTSLDSLKMRLKTHTEVITNTVEIIREKKPKLITTSPSVTAGYDPINKQWGVMMGISANLNIW